MKTFIRGPTEALYLFLYVASVIGICLCSVNMAKIGLLVSENNCCDVLSYENKGSAINIALDRLKEDGVLEKNFVIEIAWKDSRLVSDGVGNVVDLVTEEDVDVIFGSPSSKLTIPAAHLTSYWNFPHITWSANSHELSDKDTFTTLVRTIGPISDMAMTLVTVFRNFRWEKIGLIYLEDSLCFYCASGIKDQFADANLTIMQSISYRPNKILKVSLLNEYFTLIKRTSRIIFICDYNNLRRLMIHAYKNGMCNGQYVFISPSYDIPTKLEWEWGDENDHIAQEAFKYLLYVTPADWVGDEGKERLDEFNIQVIERLAEPPWNSTYAKDNGIPPGQRTQRLYEAMYLYGLWLNFSSANNISKRDGHAMLEFTRDLTFDGVSGPCNMGESGDRIPYFWYHQFVGENSYAETVAIAATKNKVCPGFILSQDCEITLLTKFRWYTADGDPPQDVPECGYFDELCVEHSEENTLVISLVSMVVIVLAASVAAVGFFIRKRKIEEEILWSVWKVNEAELQLSRVPLESGKSMTALQGSARDGTSRGSNLSRKENSTLSGKDNSELSGDVLMTTLAVYRGLMVAVRSTGKRVVLTKMDLYELKTMKEMQHDNVNSFIGACFNTTSPFLLFLYCRKGSLQDILENDEIKLDASFKYSLIMDMVQGMIYIHNSKVSVHGRLKSSNCLVDRHWILRITDFGPDRFLEQEENNVDDDNQKYKSLLWTSPELLADKNHVKTKEADVYSFGIILHEVFYRMGTFAGMDHLTPKEIVQRVKSMEDPPCRPEIFVHYVDVSSEMTNLMQLCWLDNDNQRPSFHGIKKYLKDNVQQGVRGNIVEIIFNRLEKYASNLEELVDQRTQQLVQEKLKTDNLLYRMLPRSCADKLKLGEPVYPEFYDAATLFFSDIVGFTSLASKSSPIQVVDLLNDLYTCFDEVISRYDAYKVETIGDAYLIVSGIPKRNGNLHAGIIADMSLDILDEVRRFKVKHLPEEIVRIRIGVHTGPCCAGVVGKSMPRYCLFGDTVNTASRMESCGQANKIHLSEATHAALFSLEGYITTFRDELPIKGKGLMRTFWLERSYHRCEQPKEQ